MLPFLELGAITLSKLERKVSLSRVLNIVLLIALVGLATFGWWYLNRESPVETISKVVMPELPSPEYLYTIYGSSAMQLNRPSYTAVNDNKIYVADSSNRRIVTFSYDGNYLGHFGNKGNGKLGYPVNITFVNGEIYVADTTTKKIHVFDEQGNFIRFFAEGIVNFPSGIAYKDNRFYILDYMTIRILDSSGKEIKSFGKEGDQEGEFYHPYALYVSEDDKIYVSDSNNNRIQVFNIEGEFLQLQEGKDSRGNGGYSIPRGIAFDATGNLYTAEGLSHCVAVANKEGHVVLRFSFAEPIEEQVGAEDSLKLPTSVFIDENQRLYVTEFGKSRVVVYDLK